MRGLLVLFAILIAMGPVTGAQAASGKAMGVDQDAKAEASSEDLRVLDVGSDIFIGDRVITDDHGLVQIRFSDKTELTVGPRSALLIEDYLLRDDGSAGRMAINALSGTFRFVTGGAAKDRYLIKTPTGTIGVRGTAFDFNVKPDHASLLLFHGEVVMCNLKQQCVTVSDYCDVGMFDTAHAELLGNAQAFTGTVRTSMRGMFPYAVSEADLLGSFRIQGARDCLNRAVVNNAPQSIAPDGSAPPPKPRTRSPIGPISHVP